MMQKDFKELLTLFPQNIKHLIPGPGKLIVKFITPAAVDKTLEGGLILPSSVFMKNPQDLLKMAVVIRTNFVSTDAYTRYFEQLHKDGLFGEGTLVYMNGLSGVHFQRLDPATSVVSEKDLDDMYGIISFQEILFFDASRRYVVNEDGSISELSGAPAAAQEKE